MAYLDDLAAAAQSQWWQKGKPLHTCGREYLWDMMQLVGFLLSLSSEGLRLGSWTRGSWLVISVCVWQILHLCLTNFIFVFDKFYIGVWQVLYLYLTNIIFVFDKYYIYTCTCISKRLRLGSWGSWARQENISYVWLDPESALLCIHVFMLHVAFFIFFSWSNIA